jgi:type II secretory pathway pseudopilin PulG
VTPSSRGRRRAQAGTTLVELIVSLSIIGLALALIIGTLSTGALNSTLAKRNTAVEAIVQYELGKVAASAFSSSATGYSECFAIDSPTSPTAASAFQGTCPAGPYTLRSDVTWNWLPSQPGVQMWTISVASVPDGNAIGSPVSTYKVTQ